MDTHQIFALVLLGSLGLATAGPVQARQAPACEAEGLIDAITFFVDTVNNARDTVLQLLNSVNPGPTDDPFAPMAAMGIDLNTSEGVETLACFIDSIDSLESLAAITGQDISVLRLSYDNAMRVYNMLGRVEGLRELLNLEINHLQWAIENGALNIPLDLTPVETWNHIYEIMQMPAYDRMVRFILFMTSGQPIFGIGQTPEELTRLLLSAETLDDLAIEFNVPVQALEFMMDLLPHGEQLYAVGVGYLGILQELENRGFADW